MLNSNPVFAARGRHNALKRYRSPDDPELVDARGQLKAEHLAAYIKKTVDAAPPLTSEQLARLALLLRGGDGEPPGGPVASSIRRNTSAEAVAQPRRSRELTEQAEAAEAELSALTGGAA